MKPITLNITNLVGTIIVIGDKEKASEQIQENVSDALLKVLKRTTECTLTENHKKDYKKARHLLSKLIVTVHGQLLQLMITCQIII